MLHAAAADDQQLRGEVRIGAAIPRARASDRFQSRTVRGEYDVAETASLDVRKQFHCFEVERFAQPREHRAAHAAPKHYGARDKKCRVQAIRVGTTAQQFQHAAGNEVILPDRQRVSKQHYEAVAATKRRTSHRQDAAKRSRHFHRRVLQTHCAARCSDQATKDGPSVAGEAAVAPTEGVESTRGSGDGDPGAHPWCLGAGQYGDPAARAAHRRVGDP